MEAVDGQRKHMLYRLARVKYGVRRSVGSHPRSRLALALEKTLSGKSPTMKKDSWRDGSFASGTVRQAATARAESANVAENG